MDVHLTPDQKAFVRRTSAEFGFRSETSERLKTGANLLYLKFLD